MRLNRWSRSGISRIGTSWERSWILDMSLLLLSRRGVEFLKITPISWRERRWQGDREHSLLTAPGEECCRLSSKMFLKQLKGRDSLTMEKLWTRRSEVRRQSLINHSCRRKELMSNLKEQRSLGSEFRFHSRNSRLWASRWMYWPNRKRDNSLIHICIRTSSVWLTLNQIMSIIEILSTSKPHNLIFQLATA